LPYRVDESGALSVLLVTSRETRRWVVPKGNPIRGLSGHQAAAQEAYEEAGVVGITCPAPLGHFHYDKRKRDGSVQPANVALYPVAVVEQLADWPERAERETRWFDLETARDVVTEPELKRLIGGFRAPTRRAGRLARILSWARSTGGERFAMLGWFQALMPKGGRFFEQFEEHSKILVAGADALARLLNGKGDIPTLVREIQSLEHQADDVTRDVLHDVRRTLITPFDRTAISGLISVMDDAIDQMNKAGKSITLFELTAFEPAMHDMAGIIVEAARMTAEAVPLLRSIAQNSDRILHLTARIVEIEGTADDIHDAGLKALYQRVSGPDLREFIVNREIYSHLEKIVDRFEDVANEIQGLVIDHA
jgi:predicted phosphate transport protein (TIGR00153 family)